MRGGCAFLFNYPGKGKPLLESKIGRFQRVFRRIRGIKGDFPCIKGENSSRKRGASMEKGGFSRKTEGRGLKSEFRPLSLNDLRCYSKSPLIQGVMSPTVYCVFLYSGFVFSYAVASNSVSGSSHIYPLWFIYSIAVSFVGIRFKTRLIFLGN